MAQRLHREGVQVAKRHADRKEHGGLPQGEYIELNVAHRQQGDGQRHAGGQNDLRAGGCRDQVAHSQAHDEPGIEQAGAARYQRNPGKPQRELVAAIIGQVIDLLNRADHPEQRAKDQRLHQNRDAHGGDTPHFAHARGDLCKREGAAVFDRQRLGQADADPKHGDQGKQHEGDEDTAPAGEIDDHGAKGGGDGGNQGEDHHGKRHDARHFAPRIEIAHDGQGHDARPGGADALNDAGNQDDFQRLADIGHEGTDRIDDRTADQHRLAPEPIRERAREEGA